MEEWRNSFALTQTAFWSSSTILAAVICDLIALCDTVCVALSLITMAGVVAVLPGAVLLQLFVKLATLIGIFLL